MNFCIPLEFFLLEMNLAYFLVYSILLQTSDTFSLILLFLLLVDVRVPLYTEMVFQYFIMLVTQVRHILC